MVSCEEYVIPNYKMQTVDEQYQDNGNISYMSICIYICAVRMSTYECRYVFMCMYVCMWVYVCMYVCGYMYVCMCVYMFV